MNTNDLLSAQAETPESPKPKQSMEVVDESKHLFFGDSVVGVSTPLRGGPDMQGAWLAYARRHARSPK
jgi:hypothetical protein